MNTLMEDDIKRWTASLQQGLKDDGVVVSLVKLCQWFRVPRRTVYYRTTKGTVIDSRALQHASRVIRDWIGFYNHQRPH